MRYHWLHDRQTKQQFNIFWEKGTSNNGDYYTKHHAITVHRSQRPKYVRDKLKECLNLLSLARVCWYVTMTSPQDAKDVTWLAGIQDSGKINTCTHMYVQVEQSTKNCSWLDQLINIVTYWFITWSVSSFPWAHHYVCGRLSLVLSWWLYLPSLSLERFSWVGWGPVPPSK